MPGIGTHELTAIIGAQYSWAPTLSRIFSEHVSGIDIVVRYRGVTFTARITKGVAEITGVSEAEGFGDVADKGNTPYKVCIQP
jgi:hypothetical protein